MFVELIWRPKVSCGGISSCSRFLFIVLEILGEIPLKLPVEFVCDFLDIPQTSIKHNCIWIATANSSSWKTLVHFLMHKISRSLTAAYTSFNYLRLLTTQTRKIEDGNFLPFFAVTISHFSRTKKHFLIFHWRLHEIISFIMWKWNSDIDEKKCCRGRRCWRTSTLWSLFPFVSISTHNRLLC